MSAYNNEQDGDCLSEIIMVTLVGATPLMGGMRSKKGLRPFNPLQKSSSAVTLVGATPLMLPVQQTYLHSYTKKKY